MSGLIPLNLLVKSNRIVVMNSGVLDRSTIIASPLRVDFKDQALDQQPLIMVFDQVARTETACFVQHGDWQGRTYRPGPQFFQAVQSSGLTARYPLPVVPVSTSGRLSALATSQQSNVWWGPLLALQIGPTP
ncbi:MAG: hypothetical protein HYR85_08185 [Planctomycetes bacterium]|nr:hypothetical protein [Planctomycetota bacterium]MBI3843234.1 hypothetical protein [Planctomycetota bacterium]